MRPAVALAAREGLPPLHPASCRRRVSSTRRDPGPPSFYDLEQAASDSSLFLLSGMSASIEPGHSIVPSTRARSCLQRPAFALSARAGPQALHPLGGHPRTPAHYDLERGLAPPCPFSPYSRGEGHASGVLPARHEGRRFAQTSRWFPLLVAPEAAGAKGPLSVASSTKSIKAGGFGRVSLPIERETSLARAAGAI